jgi:hypothetical protein
VLGLVPPVDRLRRLILPRPARNIWDALRPESNRYAFFGGCLQPKM